MRKETGNTYCHSAQTFASSHLPPKNTKTNTSRTIILPVVLYGCETWSLIRWEEHRLRVCGNWVLRKVFGAKREEVKLDWSNLWCSPNIIRVSTSSMRWRGKGQVWGTKMRTGIWWESERKNQLRKIGVAVRIILKWVSKKSEQRVWTGLIWLRAGQVPGCFECGNEHYGSIEVGKFLD
jgi:hypothetical protein